MRQLVFGLLLAFFMVPTLAATPQQNPDPWESFNRKMFSFDMTMDKYLLKPAAKGYRAVTPDWGEGMVHNFFANLKEIPRSINALLQLKFKQAGSNFGRFLLNSTLGIGGLFDVASDAGLKSYQQDFGLTLAHWGVDRGPYLVLPFFGPSTVRDSFGMIPDTYLWPPHYLKNNWTQYALDGLYGVDKRAGFLGLEEAISGDKYIFVRNYYLQHRRRLTGKKIVDTFGANADFDSDVGW